MKEILDGIPDAAAPDIILDRGHEDSPVLGPDDDDVIRPDAEEELLSLGTDGSLVNLGNAPLAKHLIWTFGPHHRDFPLLLQLRVEIDGDRLVSVDPEIGWHHQGIEKALEGRAVEQAFGLVARLAVRTPSAHVVAWALAIERLLGIDDQVDEKTQLWRTIVVELTRIREHLAVLSSMVLAHSERRSQRVFLDAARRLDTLLLLATRNQAEPLLWAIGRLRAPVPETVPESLERALPDALGSIQSVGDLLWQNPAFLDSLSGLGALTRREAAELGLSGPALRACGSADDLRRDPALLAYGRVSPRVVTHEGGDNLARFAVRLDEVASSSALIVRALAALKGTPEPTEEPELPRDADGAIVLPNDVAGASIETASGELSVIVAGDGSAHPARARFRGPSFPLTAALPRLLTGARLDDVVPILLSLGISGAELDR